MKLRTFMACWIGICTFGLPTAIASVPGVGDAELRIATRSTGTSSEAVQWRAGMEAGIQRLNRDGGVQGRKLQLIADDAPWEELAKGSFLLFAPFGQAETEAALKTAHETRIPLFGARTGIRRLAHPEKTHPAYTLHPTRDMEMEAVVSRFHKETGRTRIAVCHSDDVAGRAWMEAARRALDKSGLGIHGLASLSTEGTDTASAARLLRAGQPDLVLVLTPGWLAADFIREMRSAPTESRFLTPSSIDPERLAGRLMNRGVGVLSAQAVPFPFYRKIPIVGECSEDMARMKRKTGFIALEAYVTTIALGHVLREMEAPTRKAFHAAARNVFDEDLGGVTVDFTGKDHIGSRTLYLNQLAPGGFVSPIRNLADAYAFKD